MLGLPLDAWLLLIAAVGLGLGLELTFYARSRREAKPGREPASAPPGSTGPGGDA